MMNRLPTVVVRKEVLESWLSMSNYTRSRLANELGVSKGRVSQILTSLEEPSANLIARLMVLTNLPFDRLFRIVRENDPLALMAASAQTEAGARPVRRRAAKRQSRKASAEFDTAAVPADQSASS